MSIPKLVIGIDPGLSGGIAIYDESTNSTHSHVMPITVIREFITKKKFKEIRTIDTQGILDLFTFLLKGSDEYQLCLYIEEIHSLFGVSAGSNFSFGYGYGKLHATIESMQLPYTSVQPKKWQSVVWVDSDIIKAPDKLVQNKKGEVVTKKGKIDTKATTLNSVNRLYPHCNLKATSRCKIAHDGMVDAIAIMHHGIIQEKIL